MGTREPDTTDRLFALAKEYVVEANAVMKDGQAKWGLQILVADLMSFASKNGINFTNLVSDSRDVYEDRRELGVYTLQSALLDSPLLTRSEGEGSK